MYMNTTVYLLGWMGLAAQWPSMLVTMCTVCVFGLGVGDESVWGGGGDMGM
jgi:hypothetical protein